MVEAGAQHIPLVIESGQVIDTHHVALLVAAGASAVFPYLALEQAAHMKPGGADSLSRRGGKRAAQSHCANGYLNHCQLSQQSSVRGHWSRSRSLQPIFRRCQPLSRRQKPDRTLCRIVSIVTTACSSSATTMTTQLQDQGLYRFRHQGEQHGSFA